MAEVMGDWFYLFAVVAGSFVLGIALDWVIVAVLRHDTGSGHNIRRSVAGAMRWQPEIWAILVAVTLAKPFAFLGAGAQAVATRSVNVLAIVSVTVFAARLAGWLIRVYLSQDSVDAPTGTIFVNLARLTIWAVGITIMLGAMGVQIGPLMASLGVVGLAVSLGLQDTLANFFSGLQITLSRQIQPGDYIRLSTGEEGTTYDVTWRNTSISAPSGDLIIVPNALIAKALMTNFSAADERHTAVVTFTVAYGTDLEAVKTIAEKVATSVRDSEEAAIEEFEPLCRFTVFRPEGVQGSVGIRTVRYQDRIPVVDALVTALHRELVAEGISFGEIAARA